MKISFVLRQVSDPYGQPSFVIAIPKGFLNKKAAIEDSQIGT
jgi:hypothetical protein